MRAISNPIAALLEPGYKVDRYELLAKIGQGGMASVWLARDESGDGAPFYAIKTILPRHASDEQLRKMMLDEARIAMAIDHPNVARTIEVGTLWDMPYLVLEYVSGESLDQLCQTLTSKGQQVPADIAIRIVIDTCRGLHAAHEAANADGSSLGIVHRDLSPQNILVDEDGAVKLIDFGIAKANERLGETESGVTKGKVPYMAPEQALDAFVDRRADIWSLGAVLYMLLAGKYPFDGANDAARLGKKLSGDPPAPLPDTVPVALREVVERALSFYREARFDTALDLATALEESASPASGGTVKAFFARQLGPAMKARALIVQHALAAASARDRARELLGGSAKPSAQRSSGESAAPRTAPRAASANDVPTSPPGEGRAPVDHDERTPIRPWIPYVSAAVIALVLIVAFVLGSATGRRGESTVVADDAGSNATLTGAAAGHPGTNESASVPSLRIGNGSAAAAASAPLVLGTRTTTGGTTTAPLVPAATTAGAAVVAPSAQTTAASPASARPAASVRPPRPGVTVHEDTIF